VRPYSSIYFFLPSFFLTIVSALAQNPSTLLDVPVVEEVSGTVLSFDLETRHSEIVLPGQVLTQPLLIRLTTGSSLIFSCPGGMAGRITGPAEFILGPASNNRYEVDLRRGTIAVLLDPNRPAGSPQFAIRTADGLALAKGTYYAVTEYKGQSYVKVKRGEVKTKTKPPAQPDFSAYLKKSKAPMPSSKK
jgi:hypothetical protein